MIVYRHFDRFSDIPKKHIPTLKQLTLGPSGTLDGLINHCEKYSKKVRNINIAYEKGEPVGWCILDSFGGCSFFVKPSFRGQKIGTNLAINFIKHHSKPTVKGHKDHAAALLKFGAIRIKSSVKVYEWDWGMRTVRIK